VPSSEQRRPKGHEVRDAVRSIADELVQDAGDQGEGFGAVEAHAAGEAALGEGAQVRDGEFV
jgi:hypothetical protein